MVSSAPTSVPLRLSVRMGSANQGFPRPLRYTTRCFGLFCFLEFAAFLASGFLKPPLP